MAINDEQILNGNAARAFGMMAVAFVFFLDVRVGSADMGIDLLPDVIGWVMVVHGLSLLRSLSAVVPRLRVWAVVVAVLSVFDIVEMRVPVRESGPFTWWVTPLFSVGLVQQLLDLVVVWGICGLIIAIAAFVGDRATERRARTRRMVYVIFSVVAATVFALSWLAPAVAALLLIPGIGMAIIVFVLMMLLMKDAQRLCRSYATHQPATTSLQSAAFGGA